MLSEIDKKQAVIFRRKIKRGKKPLEAVVNLCAFLEDSQLDMGKKGYENLAKVVIEACDDMKMAAHSLLILSNGGKDVLNGEDQ